MSKSSLEFPSSGKDFIAPTEQAVRQKAARGKRKEELMAQGLTDAEIK